MNNKNSPINNLSDNLMLLIKKIKTLHDEMLVESVKNPRLRSLFLEIGMIQDLIRDLLVNISGLKEVNADMYVCFENNTYLSVINGVYIVSKMKGGEINILFKTKKLQRALEKFIKYAYN